MNSLASENQGMKNEIFERKDRMKKLSNVKNELETLKKDDSKTKEEMRQLSLKFNSIVEKLEKLLEG